MIGAGKYDKLCSLVRTKAQAQGAVIIVLGGNRGSGFSCQLPGFAHLELPKMLRHMADEIEKDIPMKN